MLSPQTLYPALSNYSIEFVDSMCGGDVWIKSDTVVTSQVYTGM